MKSAEENTRILLTDDGRGAQAKRQALDELLLAETRMLRDALQPFADLLDGDLGGGTLISPTIKVQMVKDAKNALKQAIKHNKSRRADGDHHAADLVLRLEAACRVLDTAPEVVS